MNTARQWDKKNNVVFAILLLGGVGLCLGGIWVPPLLVPGGVFLAGAFGMWGSAYTRMYPWREDDEPARANIHPIPTPIAPPSQTFIQNNLFFIFTKKLSSGNGSESPRPLGADATPINRLIIS